MYRVQQTFTATKATVLYRLHPRPIPHPPVTLLAHGCPPQAIVAAFGFDERTVATPEDIPSLGHPAVYWHRVGARLTFATSATDPDAVHLLAHSEVPITRHVKVQGNRSPYDGDWVYWIMQQEQHPNVGYKTGHVTQPQHEHCHHYQGCSSNMTTGLRWTISMGTTVIRDLRT